MKNRSWILGALAAGVLVFSAGSAKAAGGLPIEDIDIGPGTDPAIYQNVAEDLFAIVQVIAPATQVHLLISCDGTMSGAEQARITTMIQSLGGTVDKSSFQSFRGYAATVPADKVDNVARDAASYHVAPDRTVKPSMDVALRTIGGTPVSGSTLGLSPLGAVLGQILPSGDAQVTGVPRYTGAGVTVAVIDSGVGTHADFMTNGVDRVAVRWSALGGSTSDEFGHGTHVAGIAGGNGASSSGSMSFRTFSGVAPGIRLISLKVLGADGSGQVTDVLKAIDWVLENRVQYDIRIVNMSLGHPVVDPCGKDALCQAVESLSAAGIAVVVSAGNWGTLGYGSITSPGIAPNAITIGATKDLNTCATKDDGIASYSSRGPTWPDHLLKPDLVAPGNKIVSLNPKTM